MGLLRTAVIVAVGVSLLPSDPAKQESLYQRAASATTWTLTFCERNGSTCKEAGALWAQFVTKAEFGARLAYDMVREGQNQHDASLAQNAGAANGPVVVAPAQFEPAQAGTLTPDDRKPAWRGRKSGQGSI